MSETPWKNGYWNMSNMPSYIFILDGEKAEAKPLIALDFPDVKSPMPTNTIKYGDFGEARKEVAEATGSEKNNVEIVWEGTFKMPGVVNEDGTEITMWEDVSKIISTMKWLTPEKVEEMKEARDDLDAPR